MFEQEVEMEQQQSSVLPLILIIAMILAFVAVAGYYVVENRKVLPATEAGNLISDSLKKDGPVTIHIRTGLVVASVQDRPHDPNYRLLEKAGLLNVGKDKGRTTPVTLTAEGRKLLSEIPGVKETRDAKDGTLAYDLPLAERKLAGTPTVTMMGMGRAKADFDWAWAPNQMGELFDASGAMVKSFNTWERGTLIDKYGAKFYHAAPTKATMYFTKEDKGWQITAE